jgi:ornithine carbamoyltransferase
MSANLAGRHLLSMADLSPSELGAVLDLATQLKKSSAAEQRQRLAGRTLAMIFQKPSLRTRVSFETGMTQLGGHAIYLAPSDIKLGERETIEDVALTLGRYADLIMARVFGHDTVVGLARHAGVPVINGLSDLEHPCQILADLLTVRERRGALAGLRGVYVGDGNNVAHSLMLGAALSGMNFTVVTPPGFEPQEGVLTRARELASKSKARIQVSHDVLEAARGADVLYTDVWASMGQEAEAEARRQKFKGFQLNRQVVERADPRVVLLHCLPAHYGDEIDYETSRLPCSAIFDQAENRLHAQKAILLALAGA